MRKRTIVSSMSEDGRLARLGVNANLLFDRLISISDEAGLCPGEVIVIKGKCFPLMDEMTDKKIETALSKLKEVGLVHLAQYKDRTVLCLAPGSFQRHQSFRKDYKRRFDYGPLSEVVFSEGLTGFRTETERVSNGNRTDPIGFVASDTVTVTESVTDTDTGASCTKVDLSIPEELKKYETHIKDWLDHRRAKRKLPKTQAAANSMFKKMEGFGEGLPDAIEHSLANDYQGIYAEKGKEHTNQPSPAARRGLREIG